MKLRTLFGAAAIAALAAPTSAAAQVDVGGPVFSSLALVLTEPKGLPAFTKAKTYEMSIAAHVTATDSPTLLSIADGDAISGSRRGHISVGAKQLSPPLEAAV